MNTALTSRFLCFGLVAAVGLAVPSVAQQSQPMQPNAPGVSKSKNGDPLDPEQQHGDENGA
jgi:hypothetical protein